MTTDVLQWLSDGAGRPVPSIPRPDAQAAEQAIVAGRAMRDAGACLAALDRFDAAVALDPANAEAHAARGEVLLDLGRPGEAAAAFQRAAAIDTGCGAYWRAYAEALAKDGRFDEAVGALASFLALRPDSSRTRLALARLQEGAGRLEAAIAGYREALFATPDDIDVRLALGRALLAAEALPEAIAQLQRCLRSDPDHAAAHFHLARALRTIGEREAAGRHLKRCLDLDPADELGAAAELADLEAENPGALPPGFVRCLFDQYADRFDAHLLDALAYRGHVLVREAVEAALGPDEAPAEILDLGCGTGLAGVELRALAKFLAGCDLSARMVEKARQRGVYDSLLVGDLRVALAERQAAWQVIVAADVLAYLGDLAPVLAAVRRALRPGGVFVATVEDAGDADVVLQPTRRFAHGAAHIRRAAADCGLAVEALVCAAPRREKGRPVAGLVFTLRRPPEG